MGALETRLRARSAIAAARRSSPTSRAASRASTRRCCARSPRPGADAIEVGIPHSDPIMDGGVIQEASRVALERGTHPRDVLATIADAALDVPVAVMTYANIVAAPGARRRSARTPRPPASPALIVPDLPVDEAAELEALAAARADRRRAAGGARDDARALRGDRRRLPRVRLLRGDLRRHRRARGARRRPRARSSTAMRPHTDLPLLVGVGIATPAQRRRRRARSRTASIVGSALMARLLEDDRAGMLELAAAFRSAVGRGVMRVVERRRAPTRVADARRDRRARDRPSPARTRRSHRRCAPPWRRRRAPS